MKKTAKIIALILLAVTTIVSCTKNNSSNDGNQNANLIGKWKCVSYNEINSSCEFSWSSIGSFWNIMEDGTLELDVYFKDENHTTKHLSVPYVAAEKWLTMYLSHKTFPFKIIENTKDKLVLNGEAAFYDDDIHIEFEKAQE
jgi:hypothetical protein